MSAGADRIVSRAGGTAGSPFGEVGFEPTTSMAQIMAQPDDPPFPPAAAWPVGGTEERLELLWDHYERDVARWHGLGSRDVLGKATFAAADVAGLRAIHFYCSVRKAQTASDLYRRTFGAKPTLAEVARELRLAGPTMDIDWTGCRAVPYLLDPASASIFINSRPPEAAAIADLQLPFDHVLLILGAPFQFAARSAWWDEEWVEAAAEEARLLRAAGGAVGMSPDEVDTFSKLYERGGRVHGVLFSSDGGGGLSDDIVWLLGVNASDKGPSACILHGRISDSHLSPLIHNLAAAVAWGPWKAPDPEVAALMVGEAKAITAAAKKGATRRKARHADLHGVHVVDLGRAGSARPANEAGLATGRTVIPHLRRGHWRSSRVATRDDAGAVIGDVHGEHGLDWHYEGRFIAPTVVNAGAGEPRPTVYRIPEPEELRDTDHLVPEPEEGGSD